MGVGARRACPSNQSTKRQRVSARSVGPPPQPTWTAAGSRRRDLRISGSEDQKGGTRALFPLRWVILKQRGGFDRCWECPDAWWVPRPSKPLRGSTLCPWWVRFPSTPVRQRRTKPTKSRRSPALLFYSLRRRRTELAQRPVTCSTAHPRYTQHLIVFRFFPTRPAFSTFSMYSVASGTLQLVPCMSTSTLPSFFAVALACWLSGGT